MRSVLFWVTDVLGQPIGPIFKGQKIEEENCIRDFLTKKKKLRLGFLDR
jgi:hypothetical protein